MESGNSYVGLPKHVTDALVQVSSRLRSFKISDFVNTQLFAPSTYLLKRNGKLLRPALVLMGAHVVGKRPSDFVDLAVAAELLHTSSLIHDDIIDDDMARRGTKSVHSKYGSKPAILAGDALISKAVSLSARYGEDVLMSITKSSMDMCAGEMLDYSYQDSNSAPGLDEYINVSFLKSASLIAACWSAGAVYSNSKIAEKVHRSGVDIGIAFQIRDDILDFIRADKKHSRSGLVPNAVTSLQKEYDIDKSSAIIRAVELNNRYIDMAEEKVKGTKAYEVLGNYSALIRVHI